MLTRVVDGVTTTFAYNADNKLTTVSRGGSTIATFVYDGDGTRVQSTINGVTTKFVGDSYEVTGTTVTKYYGGGAMRVGGVLYYLLSDHLGSNSLILDTAGAVVGETRYTAWGEERYSSGTVSTDYTYTGQYSNTDDFGLMYYKARWYDPQLGRFAQADRIVPGAGNPLAWDRYAYVGNNPIISIDPSGHMEIKDGNESYCVSKSCKDQKLKYKKIDQVKNEVKEVTPFSFSKHIRIGFHVGFSSANIPDQSSDDFLTDYGACGYKETAAMCALAAAERFAYMGPSDMSNNFWVNLTISYSELNGTTISNLDLYNYSGEDLLIQSIKIESGENVYWMPGPLYVDTGFGAQKAVAVPFVFSVDDSINVSIEYRQEINIGSAAHPGPMWIYPNMDFSLPSSLAVQSFLETGILP